MTSPWSTPVAVPVAVPVAPVAEPVDVVLNKQGIDINERVRQIVSSLNSKSKVFSDSSAVVEQLPALLLLLKEASSPSAWLTEDSAKALFQLFSIHSPESVTRLLLSRGTTFVLPLGSLPSSIDWSSELSFFRHLNFNRRGLINMQSKTITLDAIDYYFLVMAVLSLVSNPSASSGSTSWYKGASAWYVSSSSGSIYDRLLMEILSVAASGGSAAGVPAALAHKCELTFAAILDVHLQLNLFTYNNMGVDFGHEFKLLKNIFEVCIKASPVMTAKAEHGTAVPAVTFANKLCSLLTNLLDSNNFYSQKFLLKCHPSVFRQLTSLWRTCCLPWENATDVSTAVKDVWIHRHSDIFALYTQILTCPPVAEFAKDFKAHATDETRLTRFVASKDVKEMIESLIDVFSVVSPSTGIAEAIPSVFTSGAGLTATKVIWSICRSCTWINGKVPPNMSDPSWRMDAIVNAAKTATSGELYSTFSWEQPDDEKIQQAVETTVPKRLTNWVMHKKENIKLSGHVSWDQPVCASEVGPVVNVLRNALAYSAGIDVKANPYAHAWIRYFASVSVLIVISFSSWMWTSVVVCPRMGSNASIAITQLFFSIIVALLAMKWITSQYMI